MKRRLIQQGNKSYSVTIPRDWVRKNGLSKKTDLEIEDSGSCLTIHAINKTNLSSTEIRINDEKKEEIVQKIIETYSAGFSEITVIFLKHKPEKIEEVQTLLEPLYGVTIEKKKNQLIVCEDHAKESCEAILKKAYFGLVVLSQEIEQGKTNQRKLAILRQKVFFLTEFAFRQINRQRYAETSLTLKEAIQAFVFQVLCDLIIRIAKRKAQTKKEKPTLCEILKNTYDTCYREQPIKNTAKPFLLSTERKTTTSIEEDICLFKYLCERMGQIATMKE